MIKHSYKLEPYNNMNSCYHCLVYKKRNFTKWFLINFLAVEVTNNSVNTYFIGISKNWNVTALFASQLLKEIVTIPIKKFYLRLLIFKELTLNI